MNFTYTSLNQFFLALLFLSYAPTSFGQIAEMEGATPSVCHYTIDSIDSDSPCQRYGDNIIINRTEALLKLRLPFESEKAFKKFIAGRSIENVCVFFKGSHWAQGTVKYKYNGSWSSPFVANAGEKVFTEYRTCNGGATVVSADEIDRVGPTLGSKSVSIGLFPASGTKRYKYWTATNFSTLTGPKPSLDTANGDYVAMSCRLATRSSGDDYVSCSENPNSKEFCHLKFFAAPTRSFPYKGWWWVRGRTSDIGADKSLTVCSGGVVRQLASEVATNRAEQQNLRKIYATTTDGVLATLGTIINGTANVGGMYDFKGDATGASPADPLAAGYKFEKITKCFAPNANRVNSGSVWYKCSNKGEDQVLSGLEFESTGGISYDVTDNNKYELPDANDNTADCIIRPKKRDGVFAIDQFMFTSGPRLYTSNYSEASDAYVMKYYTYDKMVNGEPVPTKKLVTNDVLTLADGFGPFARANNNNQVAIVASKPRNGKPVKLVTCSQVEYVTTKPVN